MAVKLWKIAITFGLPWSIFMIVFGSILNGSVSLLVLISSFAAGAFSGWIFSILIRYAASSLYESIVVETAADEKTLMEAGANHVMTKESVGGKLVLTNKQLIFKSHLMNTQYDQCAFFLSDVERIVVARSFLFSAHRLCVTLRNGVEHKFTVNDARSWANAFKTSKYGMALSLRDAAISREGRIASVTN